MKKPTPVGGLPEIGEREQSESELNRLFQIHDLLLFLLI